MTKFFRYLPILILLAISTTFLNATVTAQLTDEDEDEISELNDKIEEYEEKVEELQSKGKSLSNEIASFDNQIYLTELKIKNANAEIAKRSKLLGQLNSDIDNLGGKIEKLSESISYQQTVLNERIKERYMSGEESPIFVFFGSSSVSTALKRAEYLKVLHEQDKKTLDEMNEAKKAFNMQKNLFETKKTETETLKQKVEAEKKNLEVLEAKLNDQREGKRNLLAATQNDEATYQKLLQEARDQLSSFSSFTSNAGGGSIDSNGFGKGKEGWYMSQRDKSWANTRVGKSNETILNVGCLITSVAMVNKKYGSNTTPADIAKDSSRFFSDTAMMLIPWKGPSGKSYNSISVSQIDAELEKDRPVIVGLYAGPYGTHFIVLSEKKDGDYIMYDPWYGPDLKFSSKYSKNSIFQAVVFK